MDFNKVSRSFLLLLTMVVLFAACQKDDESGEQEEEEEEVVFEFPNLNYVDSVIYQQMKNT